MKIVDEAITLDELKLMAEALFGTMVKAVVDVAREVIAVDAELHSDLESLLIEDGSKQKDLWGINFYPELPGDDFVEFDSMINVRPSAQNSSRGVEDEKIRSAINALVAKKVKT